MHEQKGSFFAVSSEKVLEVAFFFLFCDFFSQWTWIGVWVRLIFWFWIVIIFFYIFTINCKICLVIFVLISFASIVVSSCLCSPAYQSRWQSFWFVHFFVECFFFAPLMLWLWCEYVASAWFKGHRRACSV